MCSVIRRQFIEFLIIINNNNNVLYHSMQTFLPFHWPRAHHLTTLYLEQIQVTVGRDRGIRIANSALQPLAHAATL